MAQEIEAKIAVPSHDPIRRKLAASGATKAGYRLETNIFLDTPEHRLQNSDHGLRVRIARQLDDGKTTTILTVKGPRTPSALKSREEVELKVDQADEALRFFQMLGFARTLSFEKRRESWDFHGCKVELDQLPLLGTFVEIEGPDETTVLGVRDQLALSDEPMIQNSYIAMLLDKLKSEGRSETEIRF